LTQATAPARIWQPSAGMEGTASVELTEPHR
jgi:hypothetical protein